MYGDYLYLNEHQIIYSVLTKCDDIIRIGVKMVEIYELRYYIIAYYIHNNMLIDMKNKHKLKVLKDHLEKFDTDDDIDLYKEFSGTTLIEMLSQTFSKLDLRLDIEKELNPVATPPIYKMNEDVGYAKPSPEYVEEIPTAPII
jgi:hypothetical protein